MPDPAPSPVTPSAQRWLRVAILLIGTVTFLGFLFLSPIVRTLARRDREGSVARVGTGTVEQIIPPHIEENVKPIPAQVWVRVSGSLVAAEAVYGSAQLRVGGPARVTYRVGRSGRVYVDRVEPEPAPTAH